MLKPGFFITGTDTDVGKTVVTAALLRALHVDSLFACAVKPVQTGVPCPMAACSAAGRHSSTPLAGDAAHYEDALRFLNHQNVQEAGQEGSPVAVTLRSFALAASPHLAAREQAEQGGVQQSLSLQGLYADLCHFAAHTPAPFLLVEGAGGLHVPLNDTHTMLDLMEKAALPVVLVVANRLGALNHALLSVEALNRRGLPVAALVVSHTLPMPEATADPTQWRILQDTRPCLAARVHPVPVLELPFCPALREEAAEKRAQAWEQLACALAPVATLARQAVQSAGALSAQEQADSTALLHFDAAHIWHPYTSAVRPLPVREVVRTQGNKIFLRGGQALVDGMASWWCAVHGYGQPSLVEALRRQGERMSHVMFGGLTHEPAVHLAQKVLPLLPQGLDHIFFADSGSVSVEVALKMALQYWHCQEPHTPRTRFLVPRGGYHGDTVGAMSVCDPINGMHTLFSNFLPRQIFIERPACPFGAFNTAQSSANKLCDPASLLPLEQAFARHGHETAAFILEPVVQGAGGMWLYHPDYVRRAAELCREYGVLLIADEIATGFGRTGKLFACEWADVQPDILCLGKALTGGMMSLAATACKAKVAQGISGCGGEGVFMHGPTFMGNPLACAVALASVDLLLQSPWQARLAAMERGLIEGLSPCADMPGVAGVRVLGGIGVVESTDPLPMERLQKYFVEQGVWLRPFGRLIYLMPPYTLLPEELDKLTKAIQSALHKGLHIA